MKTLTSITLLPMLLVACTSKQEIKPSGDPIRINQVGYYSKESKTAVIEEDGFCDTYRLQDVASSQIVWEGKATRTSTTPWSEKKHQVVDFSTVTKPGKYLFMAGDYSKPVVIEDGCFIGSRCIVVEGAWIGREAVLGAGVVITASTPIIDVTGDSPVTYTGYVPPRSVVIPGSHTKHFPAGDYQVPCALIIGQRKESTDMKTSLNEALRMI